MEILAIMSTVLAVVFAILLLNEHCYAKRIHNMCRKLIAEKSDLMMENGILKNGEICLRNQRDMYFDLYWEQCKLIDEYEQTTADETVIIQIDEIVIDK